MTITGEANGCAILWMVPQHSREGNDLYYSDEKKQRRNDGILVIAFEMSTFVIVKEPTRTSVNDVSLATVRRSQYSMMTWEKVTENENACILFLTRRNLFHSKNYFVFTSFGLGTFKNRAKRWCCQDEDVHNVGPVPHPTHLPAAVPGAVRRPPLCQPGNVVVHPVPCHRLIHVRVLRSGTDAH